MTQKGHSSLIKHLMSDCRGGCSLASSAELFGPPWRLPPIPKESGSAVRTMNPRSQCLQHFAQRYAENLVAQMVKNLPTVWETQVPPLGQEDPLKKGTAPHSSVLAWRIPWKGSLVGYSPWGHKELDTTERLILPLPYREQHHQVWSSGMFTSDSVLFPLFLSLNETPELNIKGFQFFPLNCSPIFCHPFCMMQKSPITSSLPHLWTKALPLDTPSFSFPRSCFWYALNHPPDCWSQLSLISHSVALNEKKGSDSTRGLCRSFSGDLGNMWAGAKEEPFCGEYQEALMSKGHLFPRVLFDDHSTCHPAETVAFWHLRLIQGKNSSKHSENIKHGFIYSAFWGQPQKKRHCLEAEV